MGEEEGKTGIYIEEEECSEREKKEGEVGRGNVEKGRMGRRGKRRGEEEKNG